MKLEVPESFEEVAVTFSNEEWMTLSEQQRELHREVMVQNYETMLSVGYSIPKKQLFLLFKEDDSHPQNNVQRKETVQQKYHAGGISSKPNKQTSEKKETKAKRKLASDKKVISKKQTKNGLQQSKQDKVEKVQRSKKEPAAKKLKDKTDLSDQPSKKKEVKGKKKLTGSRKLMSETEKSNVPQNGTPETLGKEEQRSVKEPEVKHSKGKAALPLNFLSTNSSGKQPRKKKATKEETALQTTGEIPAKRQKVSKPQNPRTDITKEGKQKSKEGKQKSKKITLEDQQKTVSATELLQNPDQDQHSRETSKDKDEKKPKVIKQKVLKGLKKGKHMVNTSVQVEKKQNTAKDKPVTQHLGDKNVSKMTLKQKESLNEHFHATSGKIFPQKCIVIMLERVNVEDGKYKHMEYNKIFNSKNEQTNQLQIPLDDSLDKASQQASISQEQHKLASDQIREKKKSKMTKTGNSAIKAKQDKSHKRNSSKEEVVEPTVSVSPHLPQHSQKQPLMNTEGKMGKKVRQKSKLLKQKKEDNLERNSQDKSAEEKKINNNSRIQQPVDTQEGCHIPKLLRYKVLESDKLFLLFEIGKDYLYSDIEGNKDIQKKKKKKIFKGSSFNFHKKFKIKKKEVKKMKVPQRRKKKETTSAKQSSDLAQDNDIAEGHTPTKKRKKWQPKAKAAPSTLSVSIKPSEQSSKEEKTEKKTKNKTSKVNMKVLKKRGLNGKTHLRVSDKLADKQKKPREKIKPQQLNCKADIRFSLLNQNVHELPLEKKDEDKKEIENPENEKPEGSKNILSKEKKEDELENTDPENVGESESGGTEQLKNLTAFDSNLFDITECPCELLSEKNKYEEKEGQKDENSKEAQPKEKDMNMGGNEPSPEEKVRPEQLKNNSAPVMLPGLLELNGLPSEEEEEEEKDEKRMSSNSKMILKKTGQDAQTQVNGSESMIKEQHRPEEAEHDEMNYKSTPVMLPGFLELNELPSEEEEEEDGKDENRTSSSSKVVLKKTGQDVQTQVNGSESMIKEQHRPEEEAERDEMNCKSTSVMLPVFTEPNERPSEEEEEEEDEKDENRTSSSSKMVLKKAGQDVQTQVNGSESMIKEQHRPEEEAERDEMNCKSDFEVFFITQHPCEPSSEKKNKDEKNDDKSSEDSKNIISENGKEDTLQYTVREIVKKDEIKLQKRLEVVQPNNTSDSKPLPVTQQLCDLPSENNQMEEHQESIPSGSNKKALSPSDINEDMLHFIVTQHLEEEPRLQESLGTVHVKNKTDISEQSSEEKNEKSECTTTVLNKNANDDKTRVKKLDKAVKEQKKSKKADMQQLNCKANSRRFTINQHPHELPCVKREERKQNKISEDSKNELPKDHESLQYSMSGNVGKDVPDLQENVETQQSTNKVASTTISTCAHTSDKPMEEKKEDQSEGTTNMFSKDEDDKTQFSKSDKAGYKRKRPKEKPEVEQWKSNAVSEPFLVTCHPCKLPAEKKRKKNKEIMLNKTKSSKNTLTSSVLSKEDKKHKLHYAWPEKVEGEESRIQQKEVIEEVKNSAAPDNLPKFLHSSDQPAEEKKVGRNSEGNIKVSTERQENRSTQVSISNKTTGKQQRLKKKAKMQQLQYTPNPKHFPIKKHPPKPPSKKKKKEKKENKSESGKNLPSSLKREKEGKRQYTPLENEGRAVPRLHKKKRVEELGSSALNRSSVYIEQRSKKPSYGNCHSSLPKEKRLLSEFGKNNHELPLVSSQHSHKDKRQYKCLECNKSFIAEKQLTIHQQNHIRVQKHSDFKKGFSKMHKLIIKQWTHKWEKPYKCTKCSKVFSQEDHLLAHQKGHMRKKSHKCMQCDKRFARKEYLLNHQKVHTGEKPHTCPECNKKFAHKHNLLSHQRVHTGQKPYKCTVCNKKFAHQQNMKKHMLVHTGQKPYKCTECGKSFAQKQNLTRHQRNHTGQKPYKCSDCNKLFSHKQTLMVHQRLHTGQKPYKCAECNKNFAHKQNLIRHQRIHSGLKPYKCNECNKIFTQKPHLVAHQRVHTGQKPYKCAECNKTFAHKPSLISHQWIHMGQKPHKCNECNKYFTTHSNLLRHQQGHVR